MEGDFGFLKTVSDTFDVKRITASNEQRCEILNTGIKPYACCRQHHTAIDAVIDLKEKYDLKPEDVEHISHRSFVVGSRESYKEPTTVPGAKYSAPYNIAVALTYGEAWRKHYTSELIKDTDLLKLASKVDVSPNEELEKLYDGKWASIVEITTKAGEIYTAQRDLPFGEPEHPISGEILKRKFMSLSTESVSVEKEEKMWENIFQIDEIVDLAEFTALLKM